MRRIAVIVALLLGTGFHPAGATSIWSQRPLDTVDDIVVQPILVGDSLVRDGEKATDLFQGDRKGAEAFEAKLMSLVRSRLKAAKLRVDPDSHNSIEFSFFGVKFPDSVSDAPEAGRGSCPSRNFYMLNVRTRGPGEDEPSHEQTILGVADDEKLSEELIKSAMSVLDDILYSRRGYRERHNGEVENEPPAENE